MAPSLPDLIWTTIFRKLPIEDQLTVCKMSLRGARLVRAANRHVTTMVIDFWENWEVVKNEHATALAAGGDQVVSFDDYPTTTVHPSKWAYLKLRFNQSLDPETIESIVNAFSAVTDLNFFGYNHASCKNLTANCLQPPPVCVINELRVTFDQ
ncbi:hypothetical protein TYRP_023556 [Tyrophagus putrescentiae]|nr:hypothetical protein TYRP_023556 [Tyrophagus putrescentiae]